MRLSKSLGLPAFGAMALLALVTNQSLSHEGHNVGSAGEAEKGIQAALAELSPCRPGCRRGTALVSRDAERSSRCDGQANQDHARRQAGFSLLRGMRERCTCRREGDLSKSRKAQEG